MSRFVTPLLKLIRSQFLIFAIANSLREQALRDVTNNTALNDATTEAEVRAVWDADVLGTRPAEHT